MGFKIACIAIAREDAEKARQALGLVETGTEDEYFESLFCGGEGSNGTYVIWKNTRDADFSKAERAKLDASVDYWSTGVHEGVMSGHVDRIESGETIWRIEYVGCEDPRIFSPIGAVPSDILKLHSDIKQKSDANSDEGVDFEYEILSETFKTLCGVKYDDMGGDDPFKFFELQQKNPPKKKPFWKIF